MQNYFMYQVSYPMFFGIGSERTVCVGLEETFGAVYSKDSEILCCTCKYQKTSCSHVKAVYEAIKKMECPAILKPFISCLQPEHDESCNNDVPKCLSKKKISFTVPIHIKHALRQPYLERFKIEEGLCNFYEDADICEKCGLSSMRTIIKKNKNNYTQPNTVSQKFVTCIHS